MLRGDAGGRSFYIKPRDDVASAHVAPGLLAQMDAPAGTTGTGGLQDAPVLGHRMYFWLTARDLDAAVHTLGRLKSSE